MSKQRTIPTAVTHAQIATSDPSVSAWVAANAGSGKTHVLAQRVIRLLLRGAPPARILCITFTKAAAANMAIRVFDTLREWTALDDAALDAAMRKIGVRDIDAARRDRARQLFALTLETPGGLKVQTIHAFCAHLLHLFPFEAEVAARFEVLDEAAETQLLDRLVLSVLLDAANKPDSVRGQALATAVAAAADVTFRELLSETIKARDKLAAWLEAAGGVAGAISDLCRAFGISPDATIEQIESDMMTGALPAAQWKTAARTLRRGKPSDIEQAERLEAALNVTGTARLETYLTVFFTAQMTPRKTLVTKAIEKDDPALADRFYAERERLAALVERRRAVAARERTGALVTIAAEVIARYRAEKNRHGLLDYEDLIDKTLELLDSVQATWVHYKLDRGIDHVLIDEAQDTSPKQWAVIGRLVEEFFSGAGARDLVKRTIFAVGDEKQSIFSFQGAAPQKFAEMRRHFEAAHAKSGMEFVTRTFGHSFRSGANVLGAVDRVFLEREIFASVTTDAAGVPPHVALPDAAPGLVEIWPIIRPEERREIEAWDAPFDTLTPASSPVRLARRIAAHVSHWCRRALRPRDVLILVRRRGPLFEAIIQELKNKDIAVAGADRLVLTEHIAVMDLMALADALLLPHDDLALAAVLKSPLFGFDDEQLFRLAWNRKGTLRAALRAKAGEDAHFGAAAARLDQLAEAAARETPFVFFARLLNAERGRAQFLARLGPEAADALDEFLNLALEYERGETASLQGFVGWLRAAKSEIKRDMEITRDEVRVMTVHGAKGLEAHTVILADTVTPPRGWHPPRLLALAPERAAPNAAERLVWATREGDDVGPMAAAREAALQAAVNEYRRLLYVGMTRAAERLVICGAEGERKRPEGCWYDLVFDALEKDLADEPADDGDGTVRRYRKTPADTRTPEEAAAESQKDEALPAWLTRDAPKDRRRAMVLSPSRAYHEARPRPASHRRHEKDEAATDRAALARLRGTLLHRLMQSLPDIAPERRAEAARRYLERAAQSEKLSAAERETIAAQATALLADENFSPLFAPGSRAEVPIVGRLGERLVSGQVDRLVITADAVLIADYKTDRNPPKILEDAMRDNPDYVRQLAHYRDVLARLYPGRPVRAALLWTEVPQLMEIPDAAMEAALAEISRGGTP